MSHPLVAQALDALLVDSSAAPRPMTSSTVVSAPPSSGDVRTAGVADLSRVPTADLRAEIERRAHLRRIRTRRAEIEAQVDAFFRWPADPTFTPEVSP